MPGADSPDPPTASAAPDACSTAACPDFAAAGGDSVDPRADALTRLTAELRGPVPAAVTMLDPQHLAHLADVIARARRHEAAELAAAGERGLRFVPRLLRGPLRKVLG